jgi:hypothetical protein
VLETANRAFCNGHKSRGVRVLRVAVRHDIAPLVPSVPHPLGGSRRPILQGVGQSAGADGTIVVVPAASSSST